MNRIVKFALIFLVFSCNSSDEESSSLKCSNALKNKDYEVGIEVCSKKERGDAYMGKAGFSLIRIAEYPNGEEPLPEHIVNPGDIVLVSERGFKKAVLFHFHYPKRRQCRF